jgi:biopolymer transport protein ExbD
MALIRSASLCLSIAALGLAPTRQEGVPKVEVQIPEGQASGLGAGKDPRPEIRVLMHWDSRSGEALRMFGAKRVRTDAELSLLLKAACADFAALGQPEVPVVLDAAPQVPWREVAAVMAVCQDAKVRRIEFAAGATRQEPVVRPGAPAQEPASRAAASAPASRPGSVAVVIRHRDGGKERPCEAFAKNTTCNDETHWVCAVLGTDYTWELLGARLEKLARQAPEPGAGESAAAKVSIRSDPRAPYLLVHKVIQACGSAGIHAVELETTTR